MKEDILNWWEKAKSDLKLGRKDAVTKGLKDFKIRVSREFTIKKMILFGSMATGEAHKDSDIDLIIVSQSFRKASFWKQAIALYDYWDLDYPVDFLCLTPEEFEKRRKQVGIVSEAVKEGIEIT